MPTDNFHSNHRMDISHHRMLLENERESFKTNCIRKLPLAAVLLKILKPLQFLFITVSFLHFSFITNLASVV